MSKHRHIDAICIGITALTLLVTLLFMNGSSLGITAVASEENSDAMFTANDLNAAWDAEGATQITLADEGSAVKGNGAYVNDGDVHIVYAGRYVLSGALSDGAVVIDADGDDKIWLMLDGASIHCEDGAAIRVEQAGKVFLTLREGSENALSSGATYSEEAVSSGVDGTIYSRDDLTINGSGALQVAAQYQHGIVCNDDLVLTGGAIQITAARDAVHANDSVRIKDANLTLSAGDDGITASNDDETSFLYVESGTISIPSCCEGLEAVQITIAGGTVDIAATDDGINANGYSGNSRVDIRGGEIAVTVADGRDADGIDSNKDIYISGGKLFVSVNDSGGSCALDCGSEYGGKCEISGGTVLACGSSGMAEGFDSTSTQGFLMQTTSATAGTIVTVKDASGVVLLSEAVPCSFSSVLVSTPEMNIGDTCTLIVGETETEMTIDNASGFGGGRMRGGAGLDGEQLPGWGGWGKRSGMFGGAAQSSENAQSDNAEAMAFRPLRAAGAENTESDAPGAAAPSDTQNGAMPPDFPANNETGGMQPPERPTGEAEGMTPPDMAQIEDGSEEMPPELPQGGGDFGGRFAGGNMRNLNGAFGAQESAAQAASAGAPITAEELLLLGISVAVLLIGCAIAAGYKRRGR